MGLQELRDEDDTAMLVAMKKRAPGQRGGKQLKGMREILEWMVWPKVDEIGKADGGSSPLFSGFGTTTPWIEKGLRLNIFQRVV